MKVKFVSHIGQGMKKLLISARKAVESGEVWNSLEEEQEATTIELRDIFCPECHAHHRTEEIRLKVKAALCWFGAYGP